MSDWLGCRNAVRRSIWYCFSTGTPMPRQDREHHRDRDHEGQPQPGEVPPRRAQHEQHARASPPRTPARCRSRARRTPAAPAAPCRPARPASAGPGPTTSRRDASSAASPTISSSLPSSEGWNWNTPRLIQRWPPCTLVPITSTTIVESTHEQVQQRVDAAQQPRRHGGDQQHADHPHHRVGQLAVVVVGGVAGDVVAGGVADDPEPERRDRKRGRQHHVVEVSQVGSASAGVVRSDGCS